MNSIDAYFIDLDGTFVDIGHFNASFANYQAVKLAQSRKQRVIFSTGRNMTFNTMKILAKSNVDSAIFLNGAIIMIEGKIVKSLPIENKEIELLNEYLMNKKGVFVVINSAINKKIHSGKVWMFPLFLLVKMRLFSMKHLNTLYPTVFKYTLGSVKQKRILKIYEELKQMNLDLSITTSYKDKVIEITHKSATKGYATSYVLEQLKINKDNAVHIGDSMNDFSTKNYVSRLICMGDGNQSLMEKSDYIGPSHKKGGVAKIITNYSEFVRKK
ncbi:Cof subfamily protein (haloacid dehalogenase superfamily)/HAD superfamily hydrolase (TIGR01484 family) [Mycoplasma testudineum]|uniref:Cof subfamily protein (Haloacid dehalogenase superfamily)/HAD superfamily hydrolase (TIGR01484 family) n=1 Tax=Mycoplasma testudineum TaxID=244584 RepID=A0A4R6IEP7_9MOLU|nr:HAD family hydrolase [Mycoplasma testudineum]OYD26965.1 hypothetical protein CG473_01345 [Mycoplasma testudineum]TDO20512.1 Cof subfamily protein (haloacid dehalogenase superfamily)/HAD superfamily hydrolase (TIGR01484 family) [Mycoplasma testudineum]